MIDTVALKRFKECYLVFVSAPTTLRFEHRTDAGPVSGIGVASPRLSWIVPEADPAYSQDAYEIELARTDATEVYRMESSDQVLVPWPGPPLAPRESVQVRVRVTGNDEVSDWSGPATVEAGLLSPDDWTARFVSPTDIGGLDAPGPRLTAAFDVPGPVLKARLYATAHGLYEATLNGHRVGDQLLTPGWTSYSHRLRYQTYDVTDLIQNGQNRLEVDPVAPTSSLTREATVRDVMDDEDVWRQVGGRRRRCRYCPRRRPGSEPAGAVPRCPSRRADRCCHPVRRAAAFGKAARAAGRRAALVVPLRCH
jgi:hypothetical protein